MKEEYFKVHKDVAARAGLDSRLRETIDEKYLLLSEKDVRMITLTFEERLHALNLCPLCDQDIDDLRNKNDEDPIDENPIDIDEDENEDPIDENPIDIDEDENEEPEINEEDGN